MKTMTYFLHASDKKIAVGTTKPRYDAKQQAWMTDKGVFSTPNPSDYMVTAQIVADNAK
jgi:hypothetical protein